MENRLKALETVLVITAGLLALFFWTKNPWLLRGALAVSAAGVLSPWLAAQMHTGWTLLARGLGWLNGRVLLSLVFYVFLTPIAWLSRFGSSSSFLRSKKPAGESYFTERNHTYEKKDLEQTW